MSSPQECLICRSMSSQKSMGYLLAVRPKAFLYVVAIILSNVFFVVSENLLFGIALAIKFRF